MQEAAEDQVNPAFAVRRNAFRELLGVPIRVTLSCHRRGRSTHG
jgi:hypothetical protein